MENNLNEIVRQNIITYMNQKKVSLKDIINITEKINKSTVYHYVSGKRKISLNSLFDFSKALNINIKDLFDEETYYKFKDTYKKPYKKYINININYQEMNERDRIIYFYRKLSENKKTLQQLGDEFNISRERVRQIQNQYEQKYILGENNG